MPRGRPYVKDDKPNEKTKAKAKKELADARSRIGEIILADGRPKDGSDISSAYDKSTETLADYVTLDWDHVSGIRTIGRNIADYARDEKKSRPLNIILQADAGAGKSHLVRCLAKDDQLVRHPMREVVFNMTAMRRLDDLASTIETVRNVIVNGELPLLFLDEFDYNPDNFALLLPLLWDGGLQIGHRDLKVGKVVIVLAGSDKSIKQTIESSKTEHAETEGEKGKLLDLLSRINGGELAIPGLDEEKGDRNRKTDKVCIAASLILHRFEEVEEVPWVLLHFVSQVRFHYGVRSIYTLVDQIPARKNIRHKLRMKDLKLPFKSVAEFTNSNLARHISHADKPDDVVAFWKNLAGIDGNTELVRIVKEKKGEEKKPSSLRLFMTVFRS